MATWYVNSAATGTAAGTSWANACLTLGAAITLSAAGDDFNVLSTHAETQASANLLTFKGTIGAPNRVFSCGNTNSPATATDLSPGASVTTTGAFSLTITGVVYIYGMNFNGGSGAVAAGIALMSGSVANSDILFDTCALSAPATTTPSITATSQANRGGQVKLVNTTISFGAATGSIFILTGIFVWKNTVSALLGTIPTTLFALSGSGRQIVALLDGVDLSAMTSGTLFGSQVTPSLVHATNCRLGAGVTVSATPGANGASFDLIDCDSGATGNRQERYRAQGTLTTESTVVRSGGASDGVAALSWKIVTNLNVKRTSPFETFQIVEWLAAGAHTATVELITDNVILTNADVWVDGQFLGSGSYPLASGVTSAPATQLTVGSNLATSTATWTTTGLTTPKPQNITLSFTVATAGYFRLQVKVAKTSTTLRVDPKLTVT